MNAILDKKWHLFGAGGANEKGLNSSEGQI
jgi:hypothetical protein